MTDPAKKYKISYKERASFRNHILDWYDRHKRPIPWRTQEGQTPDPYKIWLSEIMCQQTTVQAVIPYFLKFVQTWPTVQDLAAAPKEDVIDAWAGLGYYSRARNLHKCAQVIVSEHGGVFPSTHKELLKLPGIGDYTAAAIMTMAFGAVETVIDGNIERIMARYFAITDPLPSSKPLLKSAASIFFEKGVNRPGDFAQSLMDIGATVCTPKSPKCDICPINKGCIGLMKGTAPYLPTRSPKKAKPQKFGYVYWISNDHGEILLERRDETQMLGGTIGLPTSVWLENIAPNTHSFGTKTILTNHKITHSFTHFDLTLSLCQLSDKTAAGIQDNYFWYPLANMTSMRLPTVFNKALKHYLNATKLK